MQKFLTFFLIAVTVAINCKAQQQQPCAVNFKPYHTNMVNSSVNYLTVSDSGNISLRDEILARAAKRVNLLLEQKGYRSYDYFFGNFAGALTSRTKNDLLDHLIKEKIINIQENVDEKKCTYKVTIHVGKPVKFS